MSYTRTITSNGNSISQEGGQSFNQQLDDLQEQIEEGGGGSITDLGTSSGTANALAGASLVDTATTFTAGRLYRIRTNAANSGAATCSINGGTGVAMKKSPSSAALASGDIADATELLLYYDGTNLQVLSGMTVSADEILTALGSGKWPVFRMDSVGGSANAITASVSGLTLTSGQYFWLVPASNSSSTTVNLNLNSGGNVRVKKADGSTDPASSDLQAGVIALLYYDGTYYRQMTGFPVSATDSTKLPLDGSGALTNRLQFSGTGTSAGASVTCIFRDSLGQLVCNMPTGSDFDLSFNNTLYTYYSQARGFVLYGQNATPLANANTWYKDSSNNSCYGAASGQDHIFYRNGSRIGGFPLTPSELPSQVAKYSRATSAQGSLSGSYAKNTVALNSVDANPNSNWSFSGGVATCVNAGVYDVLAQLYYSSTEGFLVINHNGNAIGGYYYSSSSSGLWGQVSVPGVSVGVGDTVEIDFFSSVAGGTIGNTYTGISVNAADKHATWLRLARRQ